MPDTPTPPAPEPNRATGQIGTSWPDTPPPRKDVGDYDHTDLPDRSYLPDHGGGPY